MSGGRLISAPGGTDGRNFEAIGDAVTGGVLGRAVEPKAGELRDGHTHETNCLNCGAALAGQFCSRLRTACPCSPHARAPSFTTCCTACSISKARSGDTLPLLAWRPGELTRRYIDGQRARFVSPIALFLFSVFLMFAVVGLSSSTTHVTSETRAGAAEELNPEQQKLKLLQEQRSAHGADSGEARRKDR